MGGGSCAHTTLGSGITAAEPFPPRRSDSFTCMHKLTRSPPHGCAGLVPLRTYTHDAAPSMWVCLCREGERQHLSGRGVGEECPRPLFSQACQPESGGERLADHARELVCPPWTFLKTTDAVEARQGRRSSKEQFSSAWASGSGSNSSWRRRRWLRSPGTSSRRGGRRSCRRRRPCRPLRRDHGRGEGAE